MPEGCASRGPGERLVWSDLIFLSALPYVVTGLRLNHRRRVDRGSSRSSPPVFAGPGNPILHQRQRASALTARNGVRWAAKD